MVILSLGQLELNYSKRPFESIEADIRKIVDCLCMKGFEKIVILFPIVKPRIEGEKPVGLKRYIAFRRIFAKLAQDDRIAIWRNPSQLFLHREEAMNLSGSKYERPAVDEKYNVIPDQTKFRFSNTIKKFYFTTKSYHEVAKSLRSELEKFNAESKKPTATGSLKRLYEPEKVKIVTKQPHFMRENKDSTLEISLRPESKMSPPGTKNQNISDPEKTKPADKLPVQIISDYETAYETDYITASEDETNPLAVNKIKTNTTNVVESVDNVKYDKNNIPNIVRKQIITETTEDPTCVVELLLENDKVMVAQLDTGALPNILSKGTVEKLTRNCPDSIKYVPLRRPVLLKLADNTIIKTMTHMVQVSFYFGEILMKMPFFVLNMNGPVCIIGRLSMKVMKIELNQQHGYAYCRPAGAEKRTVLKFLEPHEFQGAEVLQCEVPKLYEHEVVHTTITDTKAVNVARLGPEDRDNGPEKFREKLRKDLREAVDKKWITPEEADAAYEELVLFEDCFSRYPGKYTGPEVDFKFIEGDGHLKKWRGEKYKPSKKLKAQIKKAIKIMLALRIIQPSQSPYINTTAPVVKKNGDLRLCLNADELNKWLERLLTEPSGIEGIIHGTNAKWFSTLDFVCGFWQLVLSAQSRKFTAFQVDGQVYEFLRMPYGIKTASAQFIEMMNRVIPDDMEGVQTFVDDVLVTANTFAQMKDRLIAVLTLIRANGLKLNPNKTSLFKQSTQHLGYTLAQQQIGKQSEKIAKFEMFKKKNTKKGQFTLKSVKDIQTLVGLTGLYKRFIPKYHQILAPIYKLTEKNIPFEWGIEQQKAFEKLEAEYIKDFKLMPPQPNHDLWLETMVTDDAMNSVLYQKIDGHDRVAMFTSYAFRPHQKKFTIIDKEMQALVTTVHKLQMWLHGQRVHVRKDLHAIVHKFSTLVQTHRKAAGWITELCGYDLIYDLNVKKRLFHTQAPELTLCTLAWTSLQPYAVEFIDTYTADLFSYLEQINIFQQDDTSCKKIIELLKTIIPPNNSKLKARVDACAKKFTIVNKKPNTSILHRIYEDGTTVPYLPKELFYDTIDYLHDAYGHVGPAKLEQIFKRLYFFPNAMKYIREISNCCIVCKVNKNYAMRKVLEYAQVEAYTIGDVISADLFGPVANEKGDPKYLLVAKDIFSNKTWMRPLHNIKKKTVTDAMDTIVKDIQSHNVKIRKVITDNGTQFISDRWSIMLTSHGIKVGHTTCYNPQSSLVERTMRVIGDKLRIKLNTCRDNHATHHGWHEYINEIEDEINNTPTPFNITPNEAWGIPDTIVGNFPVKKEATNFKHELLNLQNAETKNDPKCTTSEYLMTNRLEEKDLIIDDDGYIRVTADGACSKNGETDAIAGIGICFSPDSEKNVSERISVPNFTNSNNLAELIAIKKALEILLFNDIKKVKIFTDSNYVTKAINETRKNWESNGWKNSRKKIVHHKPIFENIIELMKKFDSCYLQHVYARRHEYTNILADMLAKKAVYTSEIKNQKINDMTNREAINAYIRERRRLQRIHDEYIFNKTHGDPTPLQTGDMILLTEHKQSSFDRGTSAKLYPKRYGPYVINKRVTHNCYLVTSIEDPKDEKIVNIRQVTLFLTKQQQEDLRNETCLRSKLNHRSIEEKIKEYLTRHEESLDIEETTSSSAAKRATKTAADQVAKKIADDLRSERRIRRELIKESKNETSPTTVVDATRAARLKKFAELRNNFKKSKNPNELEELDLNIRKAAANNTRYNKIKDMATSHLQRQDNDADISPTAENKEEYPTDRLQRSKRKRKIPLTLAMLKFVDEDEKIYIAKTYEV